MCNTSLSVYIEREVYVSNMPSVCMCHIIPPLNDGVLKTCFP